MPPVPFARALAVAVLAALAAAQQQQQQQQRPSIVKTTLRDPSSSDNSGIGLAAGAAGVGGARNAGASSSDCPPANFTTVSGLDVRAYAAAPWYVQKQLPLNYQPPNELFCVRAEYELRDPGNVSAGLIVNNYANRGGVNGAPQGSSRYDRSPNASRLVAFPERTSDASDGRLLVGPELLLTLMPGGAWRRAFGPYWVVALGPSSNATIKYDWAIISGGPPKYASSSSSTSDGGDDGGCSTVPPAAARPMGQQLGRRSPMLSFDTGGLWFFSRKPVDPEATLVMERTAKELGLDTSDLLPVPQQGCKYAKPQ